MWKIPALLTAALFFAATAQAADGIMRCGMTPEEFEAHKAKVSRSTPVEGREGPGLYGIADFPVSGLLNYKEGTIGFWFRPDWDGAECQAPGRAFFQFFSPQGHQLNSIFCGVFNKEIYAFVTDENRKRFQAQFTCRGEEDSPWKKDQWIHVAMTWNIEVGEIRLFLNAQETAVRKFPPIKMDPEQMGAVFSLRPLEVKGTMDDFFLSQKANPEIIAAEMNRKAAQ